MSKFFDEKEEEKEEEQEKITVGKSEFTPEELEDLVGKATEVKEFEEKQGQSWSDVTKSWGKRGETVGGWKKATGFETPDEFLKSIEEKKAEEEKPKEVLDQEQIARQIKDEAKKYGFVLKEEVESEVTGIYNKLRSGEKVLNKVNRVIRNAVKKGYPQVEKDKLLEYMNDRNNPADPDKAYKLMFEKEIKEIDAKKVESIKKPPMFTEEKSTAGSKTFEPTKVTKENLSTVLKDHFSSS